jgi:hypothetical protein
MENNKAEGRRKSLMLPELILAQRVLDLFEEVGATKPEVEAALDIIEAIVRRKKFDADLLFAHVSSGSPFRADEDPL